MTQGTEVNVLVVYDSIEICQAITDSLDAGHVTHLATNCEDAWELLESTDTISIVFVDMDLPTMDSLPLLKKIRGAESQHIASLPVFIISRNKSAETAKYVSDIIGATGFINKPSESLAISNLVNSYAKANKDIPADNQVSTYYELTECLNEEGLLKHCSGILDYAKFSYEDTSLLCIQLVEFERVFKNIDESIVDQVVITIAKQLTQVCRVDEEVAYLGKGRFYIALLTTNSFRAYIAGLRLQKKIASLEFEKDGNRIVVKAAIGISATDSSEDQPTYGTLRLQAEQALQTSLDLPGSQVVRYDAKHEKGYDEEVYRSKVAQMKPA